MLLYDANSPGPTPVTVRQFVLERGGIAMDVEHVELAKREEAFLNTVNARGEVPALRLDSGAVITEITAICAYFDEVAEGGVSLFGTTPEERALANMWTRRVYGEIAFPMVTWWRGTEMVVQFYRGHRLAATKAQDWMQAQAERGLEQLDQDLAGRSFIVGDRLSMADILLNAFLSTMAPVVPWLDRTDLENVTRWRTTMAARPSSEQMLAPLPSRIG
ncbi:glutathione S-transferase family protein [Shimia sp. R11_0]|uniref:glutathione S-transferase family protein n=1 Tax=Shimia sp. R11_0 TaxID=2821096 RepID=UPI001ADA79CD|nr:glutathione S-transferase family protein [Shimia sp. R11_0]MBO9475942.1 glutathione S-transferase family protein [Shimia sp. R11_0]